METLLRLYFLEGRFRAKRRIETTQGIAHLHKLSVGSGDCFWQFTLDNSAIGKSFPADSLITQASATIRPLDCMVPSFFQIRPHPFSTKAPSNAVIGAKSEAKESGSIHRSWLEIVNRTSRSERMK